MPHWRAPWAPAVSRPPPSSAPRRPAAPRPAWDESISDLRQYSLTEEELALRRERRTRNIIVVSPPGWGPDDGSDAPPRVHEGRASPPARSVRARTLRPRPAPAPPAPPLVDYARVARDLARAAAQRAEAEAEAEAAADAAMQQAAFLADTAAEFAPTPRGEPPAGGARLEAEPWATLLRVAPDVAAAAAQAAAGRDGDGSGEDGNDAGDGDGDDDGDGDGDGSSGDEDDVASLRAQLEGLRAIVRVMGDGLRACDATSSALRRELAAQRQRCARASAEGGASASALAAARAAAASQRAAVDAVRRDLEAQSAQFGARCAALEAQLAHAARYGAAGVGPKTIKTKAEGLKGVPQQPQPQPQREMARPRTASPPPRRGAARGPPPPPRASRHVSWAVPSRAAPTVPAPGAAAPAADDVSTISMMNAVDDDDDDALPSYAALRAAAAASLPAPLRPGGAPPTGPPPALSAAVWRFAAAEAGAEEAPQLPLPRRARDILPAPSPRGVAPRAAAAAPRAFELYPTL